MLSDAAWVWLSPLLIVLGCMGLLWSLRPLLQGPGAAASASRLKTCWSKLQRVEILGLDLPLMLQYFFVWVPFMLLMLAFAAIAGTLVLAAFFKLAELTGLDFLLEYVGRRL